MHGENLAVSLNDGTWFQSFSDKVRADTDVFLSLCTYGTVYSSLLVIGPHESLLLHKGSLSLSSSVLSICG